MRLSPESLVVGLGIFLAFWYLFASIFNRRRGIAVFHWLRNDIDQLGGEVASRWLGSSGSGARIQVRKTDAPFRDLEITYLLASRELLPLFLVDLLRGKRDRLVVRARLRSSPAGEVEMVRSNSSLARRMRAEDQRPWRIEDAPHGLLVGTRGHGANRQQAALAPFLDKYGPHVQHISWSKQAPHLILVLSLADLYEKDGSASGFYDDLTTAANSASQR
jgi:hypothetical protein